MVVDKLDDVFLLNSRSYIQKSSAQMGQEKVFRTESIRKLSNFNFVSTKTFHQNILGRIAFFLIGAREIKFHRN